MKETSLRQRLPQVLEHPQADNVAYAVAVALLVLSLWLPPFSAGARFLHWDYPVVGQAGGVVSALDGAQLMIPEGALTKQLRLKLASMSVADVLSGTGDQVEDMAAEALSTEAVTLQSDLYLLRMYGPSPDQALLTLPLPEGLAYAADVYTWDGDQWGWAPARVIPEDGVIEASLASLPSIAAVVQAKRVNPSVATVLADEESVPGEAAGILTEIYADGFFVDGDGVVHDAQGASRAPVPQGYSGVAVVSNQEDGQVQPQLLTALLLDAEARRQNVEALVLLAVEKMYAGVQLDYRGLDPKLRGEYVSFVGEVADALHQEGKLLSVRVEQPRQVAEDRWETGAYDWRELGKVTDAFVIPAIESPLACTRGGQMDALLRWAVGEVNRTKLQVALSVNSYKSVDGAISRLPYSQALSEIAELAVEGQKELVSPGEDVTLMLSVLHESGGPQYDESAATYWIGCRDDQGRDCQIWLENATSMAHKLQLIADYNVRGLLLEDLLDERNDERVWDVLGHFKELLVPSMDSDFTIVWTVQGPAGDEVSVTSPLLGVEVPAAEGDTAAASLAAGPQLVWRVPDNPGDYSIVASISDDGGRTSDVRSNSISLQVPTPTPIPTPTPTPTPKPTAKPQPQPAAPATRGPGFDYGVQGDAITDGDHGRLFGLIQQMGFRWYKQQVEWFRYHPAPGQYDWGALDRIVDSASAAGIKLLFSVVKAPKWARPPEDTDEGPPSDPNTYGEFMRALASRYKGRVQAYEIWNEQNLYYEWGGLGGKLNAGKYVELLKVAYQAVKSVDPNAVVVAGALTPTGYNDGNIAIDDRVYLEQMYQAGVRNYCDAIGAHPSGYNNPPDGDWQTYQDPTASFNAKGHPSWFFRGTMESYRNIMVKYGDGAKRIWVTEFGWASVENLGAPPAQGYEYAADNTEAEQAQNIVRAYEIAKGWGWVGPMFLWNLNFGPIVGAHDEKAAFGVVRPNWGMRPAFAALVNMPK